MERTLERTWQRPGAAVGWPAVSAVGLVLAGAFFAAALTPSLLPRAPVVQGVLAGVMAALGHEIGAFFLWIWRFLGLPMLPAARARRLLAPAALVGAGLAAFGLSQAAGWQDATRAVMGLEPLPTAAPLTIALVAAAVGGALWALARAFGLVLGRLSRWLGALLPPRVGLALGVAITAWLFWAVIDGALLRTGLRIADASFRTADALIEPGIPRPEDPLRSGSAASLVAWEGMGRRGREFVATAPTVEEIAEFAGPAAIDPIRVYVGWNNAPTAAERAELALAELIRAGGFERGTVVIAIPPGTGWMDPGAHDTLDIMLGGDVATVAVQYSYLTSILALVAHPERGIDQARELFDAVYGHWLTLPREDRPRLYVHGLSQGAFNTQAALPILDMLGDPVNGALWVGSPFFSAYWAHIRDHRRPGSPAWLPKAGNGSLARAMTQFGGLEGDFAPWGPIRLVFLNYASDPIVNFTFSIGWRRPDWLGDQRPPDIAPEMMWFPVITMFQVALDSAISLQVPRFGHYYDAHDYIDGWAALLDPPGWTAERADHLRAIMKARGPAF